MSRTRGVFRGAFTAYALSALACSNAEETPPESSSPVPAVEQLSSFGEFQVHVDGASQHMEVSRIFTRRDGTSVLVPMRDDRFDETLAAKSAVPLDDVDAGSSGVPAGGGFVVFSPSGSSTTGCPNGGTTCGPIRVVNRTTGSQTARNVYAIVTWITPGVTVVSSDPNRTDFGSDVTSSAGGLVSYEHLAPSDYPSAAATPPTTPNGFRFDRIWSFKGATTFDYKFKLKAKLTACTPTATGVEDPRNAPLVDADCDGVPGASRDTSTIFVDAARGSDANDGSMRLPVATLSSAWSRLSATKTNIVGAGSFSTTTLVDLDNAYLKRLLGGYDSDNGFSRTLGAATNYSTITVTDNTGLTGKDRFGMRRTSTTAPSLLVQGWNVSAPNGVAATSATDVVGSSYGLFFKAASALDLHSMRFLPGAGGAGLAGTAGTAGGGSCATGAGGGGGGPGYGGGSSGSAGAAGTTSIGCNYGGGGTTGNGNFGGSCGVGSAGATGTAPATSSAAFSAAGYVPAANQDGTAGAAGAAGNGGGGGGGGGGYTYTYQYQYQCGQYQCGQYACGTYSCNPHSCGWSTCYDTCTKYCPTYCNQYCYGTSYSNYYGGSGGSGGAGGCGGGAGTGGRAGGASVGIFYVPGGSSQILTNVASVSVVGNTGGKGGDGGSGGVGSAGSSGGTGSYGYSTQGGNGGTGQQGSTGGSGSGGDGGPSACVASQGSAFTIDSCTSGSGGAAGLPGAFAGVSNASVVF